ncbi:MAG: glucosamine-6-phosphate deaminase [Bacteroidota bacterium]
MLRYDGTSTVESLELTRSGRLPQYAPTEKIRIVEVDNFPLLGKLTAFRFIEWVQKNPGGVISLPTGKTPEHFIKWVKRILDNWNTKEIQAQFDAYKIERSVFPDMKSLAFVQIDEFYPMDSSQHNSFNHYVKNLYINGFGLSEEKALLIDSTHLGLPPGKKMTDIFPDNVVDLTLRVRQTRTEQERAQKEAINRVDWFCMEYERKIREKGGIGFFLGGIGPDGHIAFNVRGSSFYSVTRLTGTNYETQASAATDLGGIEISRNRLVITIGLSTITCNPSCTAIIIAAGEAKAEIVRQAVEEVKNPLYPASVLQELENGRFYLTKGAASRLTQRQFVDFQNLPALDDQQIDDVVTTLALSQNKSFDELKPEDFQKNRFAHSMMTKVTGTEKEFARIAKQRMKGKIDKGLEQLSHKTFLHTEPHHDDIMLAYMPYLHHLVRDASNHHYFANLTSGFTAVSNVYFLSLIKKLIVHLKRGDLSVLYHAGYFDPSDVVKRTEDMYLFLDGTAGGRQDQKDEAEARRMLRNLIDVYKITNLDDIKSKAQSLEEYVLSQYPGAKDSPDIQTLKGMVREWEVELLWSHFGIEPSAIFPLRLGFYRGDIFSEEPQINRDVQPILQLMKNIKPDIISVTFDPEGSGPDTHYKAMQAVAEAVKLYAQESGNSSIRIWGYRNIWYRFKPSEADVMVPVSLNTLSLLHTSFNNCFGSQRAASFPSYEHDGPFSELAQQIQVEQYGMVKNCLGKEYFLKSAHPRLRATRGMIFFKDMSLTEFYNKVRELEKATEAK